MDQADRMNYSDMQILFSLFMTIGPPADVNEKSCAVPFHIIFIK